MKWGGTEEAALINDTTKTAASYSCQLAVNDKLTHRTQTHMSPHCRVERQAQVASSKGFALHRLHCFHAGSCPILSCEKHA